MDMTGCLSFGPSRLKGTYALVVHVPKNITLPIGSLGLIHFPSGYYVYVGSAQGGLSSRLQHHFRPKTRCHWHIDYLLSSAVIHSVWFQIGGSQECTLSHELANEFGSIAGFGSSDCRCSSHLFLLPDLSELHDILSARGWMKSDGSFVI
jgi:Uri superfamily endonuclease